MREFHTKPKPPKEAISFSVDGRVLEFTPPGWAPILLMKPEQPMDVTRNYLDWIGAGMSDEDGQYLLDRLLDPNDDFDIPEITEIILGLVQDASGRPTEPPTDSSEPPVPTDSTDGRHQKESTPQTLTSVG